ncbi:cytochrome c551 [Metabacillus fastidiosus]|uniref:Cytochrome c n=1 Tax=Metabacillus fastidiosus TaxID=1458 RepID=A0ABU6P089_9BACI|nr:cytochrome c [Metabacillus fastidiosus]MED4402787.1 cytochrome c [Metabacillus fastidiosus]MED4454413.1 cytochrome c [Metabacillus fastidiosus]MED4461216.1 cytochrome c [Metabacillus fastidiosus]
MKLKALGLVLGTSLVLAACGGGGDNAKDNGESTGGTATTASAEEITSKSCIQCHGQNLEGANAPSLKEIGSKYDKAQLENIINKGQGGMPGGLVSEEEASVVADWLAQKK